MMNEWIMIMIAFGAIITVIFVFVLLEIIIFEIIDNEKEKKNNEKN